jgi:enamine deaminase RidA (YjgF/YER057c/UK114 family)
VALGGRRDQLTNATLAAWFGTQNCCLAMAEMRPTRRGATHRRVGPCHDQCRGALIMTKTILAEAVTRKSAVQKMTVASEPPPSEMTRLKRAALSATSAVMLFAIS